MKRSAFLIFFIITSSLIAQDDKSSTTKYIDSNVLDFIYRSSPMIEVNYGLGIPKHEDVIGEFANIGNWDIKLGKSDQKNFNNILIDLTERYVFGGYLSSTQQDYSSNEGKILTDSYRFGFGSRDGVGYGGSFLSFIPYISQDFVWTELKDYVNETNADSIEVIEHDDEILNNYYGAIRFGDKASYGLKVELIGTLQANAYYETSVVYRRYLFWYWSGSFIVSQVCYNILGYFTDELIEGSPVLGPIFSFALKAAYQYGYYLLRKENMNWPFNIDGEEVPLTFETVNVGISFVF